MTDEDEHLLRSELDMLKAQINILKERLENVEPRVRQIEPVVRMIEINNGNPEPISPASGEAPIPQLWGEGLNGCFEYSAGSAPTILNPYYRVGGKTYTLNESLPSLPDNCILAVKISAVGGEQSAEYVTYDSIDAMQTDEQDYDYFIAPLYTFAGGAIVCDWRKSFPVLMTEYQ